MIFGSVCSGIEAASVAWKPLGWRCAFMSEIEAFPRVVLRHHYPETPLHGDFTTIQTGEYEPIDFGLAYERGCAHGHYDDSLCEWCEEQEWRADNGMTDDDLQAMLEDHPHA